MSPQDRAAHEQPFTVVHVNGEIVVTHPEAPVGVAMTHDAARESARRLLDALEAEPLSRLGEP